VRTRVKLAAAVVALSGAGVTTAALATDGAHFRTHLSGYEEVPAVSTEGGGTFRATIHRSRQEIRFRLEYGRLSGPVQQAHIHFGQERVNGGISAFLCSNLGNAPARTKACPQAGTVTGTIRPQDVVGPAAQGIAPGEFGELVRAMRAGVTYANVHSAPFPAGEVRGQIRRHDG